MSADRQHALCIDRLAFAWAKPDARAWTLRLPHLTLPVGTRAFLHGPSGSGKSTLLGLIGGVLLPNTGRVQVLGRDLAALSTAARDRFRADHLGIIFQQFNLVPYLSSVENVLLTCMFSEKRKLRKQKPTFLSRLASASKFYKYIKQMYVLGTLRRLNYIFRGGVIMKIQYLRI